MSSPSDNSTDRLKFIEFESFEQLTPLTTRNSESHADNKDGGKMLWAVLGNDRIPVVLKSVGSNVLSGENPEGGDGENRNSRSIEQQLVNELMLLSKVLPHQNIISYFGLTRVPKSDSVFAVTQYVSGGNLRQYLKHQNSVLSWNHRVRFSTEIVSGLHHIHGAGLSHRNLHPNNILVQDGHMMISDLGFSSMKCLSSSLTHPGEMIPFIEPLYLKDQSYCLDKRSDIYSLGGILSELASGRPPFESLESNRQLSLNLIVNGERDSSILSGAPVAYTQLCRRCWDADPSKRPTIEEMMKSLINIPSTIRTRIPDAFLGTSTEIKFQVEPRRHVRASAPLMSVPAISPRVDSIGWKDSINDLSEYDVIDKDELKGYSGHPGRSTSVPLVGNASLNSRRREKARSLSFGTFRKPLQGQREHQLHHSMSMSEASNLANNEYLHIGANAPLFDSRQPRMILIARYCPAKSIVKVFEQLKKRKVDLTLREAYKSKSVFHSLIWNDDLFDVIKHSQQKPARHNNFRAALKWLVTNNLDINSVDDFGWTTLHEAIWKRKEPGVILALLENHANPNIPDNLGTTPLHQCLDLLRKTTRDDENRHIFTIIKLLLQYGADPNLTLPDTTLTISGSSLPNCLFAAVYMDLPLDIIELMIRRGADTTSATFRGLHLIDFTAKINNTRALRYLTENKNLLNTTNKRTSLFNSLKINPKVGSTPFMRVGSIPAKYEKGGRKKKWSITHSR